MKTDQTVRTILYVIYFSGLLNSFADILSDVQQRILLSRRLKKSARKRPRNRFFLSADRYLLAAGMYRIKAEPAFAAVVCIFLSVFLAALKSFTVFISFALSLFAAFLPVMILLVRVENNRNKGSREGIRLVTEFYRQYCMKNRNVFAALEGTIGSGGAFPVCRKQLYSLLLRIRSEGEISGIRRCTDDLAFSLGTVWGRMFAVCIRLAAEQGADVSAGLEDIIDQLKKANRMAEDRKRLNSEASRMTVFLVPVLYFGSMALACGYLNMSFRTLLHNQFRTAEGILFFSASWMLFFFDLLLLKLIGSTRMDY